MHDEEVVAFLGTIGITRADIRSLETLPGGVSNDVYAVSTGTRAMVVKRALDKLRVTADWRADREQERAGCRGASQRKHTDKRQHKGDNTQ